MIFFSFVGTYNVIEDVYHLYGRIIYSLIIISPYVCRIMCSLMMIYVHVSLVLFLVFLCPVGLTVVSSLFPFKANRGRNKSISFYAYAMVSVSTVISYDKANYMFVHYIFMLPLWFNVSYLISFACY